MPWQDEMIPTLRVMLNDYVVGVAQVYSDESLEQLLLVASKQVLAEMSFDIEYAVSVANGTLSPDPTAGTNRNDSFVNLATIKAACIADRGSAMIAAKQAIAIKDGTSSIDLRGSLQGKLKLLEKGWCAVYDDTKFEYQNNNTLSAGVAVMTPFRLYAYNNSNLLNTGRGRNLIY